ncbi:MAG TPA: DUF167 domain-containing protein [Amphiplicatus sp.]|nr:DUF167 domain-containing protein [Amphiplicatus sp.]
MTKAFQETGEGVLLRVRVTPGASKDAVGGLWRGPDGEERLIVRVTAPPDKGRANAAAGKLIAKAAGLAKSDVAIIAGEKDRLKNFALRGDAAAIIAKLGRSWKVRTRDGK